MKRYQVHPQDPLAGLFTDLFILGATRAAAGASDFSDADGSQTFTLITPENGDTVVYPLAQAFTKVGFEGNGLTAVALDVGFTGTTESFIKDGAMFSLNAAAASPLLSEAGGPKVFDGATALVATVATTGANLNAITAGELYIYVNLLRIRDWSTGRYG